MWYISKRAEHTILNIHMVKKKEEKLPWSRKAVVNETASVDKNSIPSTEQIALVISLRIHHLHIPLKGNSLFLDTPNTVHRPRESWSILNGALNFPWSVRWFYCPNVQLSPHWPISTIFVFIISPLGEPRICSHLGMALVKCILFGHTKLHHCWLFGGPRGNWLFYGA